MHPEAIPATNEPLRIAVRRLRWFKQAFQRHVDAYGRDLGCTFDVDEAKLASVFVRWLEAIDRQKPADKGQRRAFFDFAAALMLRELVADMPVTAGSPATLAKPDSAVAFWPEGYCCTMFCVSVHAAAMAQEFRADTKVDPAIDDLRHWWSFRENARQDAGFSAGFLQMILGHRRTGCSLTFFGRGWSGKSIEPVTLRLSHLPAGQSGFCQTAGLTADPEQVRCTACSRYPNRSVAGLSAVSTSA